MLPGGSVLDPHHLGTSLALLGILPVESDSFPGGFNREADILVSPGNDDTTSGVVSKQNDPTVSNTDQLPAGSPRLEYATAYADYVTAGWPSVLPLPPGQKSPPPRGWTGEGPYPSYPDMFAWSEDPAGGGRPGSNLALRMPPTVIGIDVDAYAGKSGAVTLRRAEEQVGPLPATWRSSARPWPSGIRFYRVPAGTRLRGQLGPGVDIIQRHHRYAVVWPSIHPGGSRYQWHWATSAYDDDLNAVPVAGDELRHQIPRADISLAELPAAWIEHLREEVTVSVADPASTPVITAWVTKMTRATEDGAERCSRMGAAVELATGKITQAVAEGGLHDVARDAVWHVCLLAVEGHAGLSGALAELMRTFDAGRTARGDAHGVADAPREWRDILGRAVAKLPAEPEPACACGWGETEFGPGGVLVNTATGEVIESLMPGSGGPVNAVPLDFPQEAGDVPSVPTGQASPTDPFAAVAEPFAASPAGLDAAGVMAFLNGASGPLADGGASPSSSPMPPLGSVAQPAAAASPYDSLYMFTDELDYMPRAESLIGGVHPGEGVLDRHTLSLLVGRDASYKSFIALDWALSLATGTPWLGCPSEPTRVLYVVGEGAYGMASRKNAWKAAHPGAEPGSNFAIRRAPVNLYRRGADLAEMIKRVYEGGYGLVIFDTLRRNSSGADNNSEKDAGLIVESLDQVRKATASGSVLLVAHSGKDDRDTRGSSVFEDDADIVWRVKRDEDAELVSLWQDKRKDGPPASRRNLYPQAVPGTDSLVMVDRSRRVALAVVQKSPPRTLDVLQFLALSVHEVTGASFSAVREAGGWSGKAQAVKVLEWLQGQGMVRQEASGRNTYWYITQAGRDHLKATDCD